MLMEARPLARASLPVLKAYFVIVTKLPEHGKFSIIAALQRVLSVCDPSNRASLDFKIRAHFDPGPSWV